jgi:hypothetical protein
VLLDVVDRCPSARIGSVDLDFLVLISLVNIGLYAARDDGLCGVLRVYGMHHDLA